MFGLIQLALLSIIGLSGSYDSIVLELGIVPFFLITLVMGYYSANANEWLKMLFVAELVVWPVLIFNAVPTIESTPINVGELAFTGPFFLGFSGIVLLGSSLLGGLVGAFMLLVLGGNAAPPAVMEQLADLALLKLTDEELLARYWALQSKLHSWREWEEGDRLNLSKVVSELTRRGLKIDPLPKNQPIS